MTLPGRAASVYPRQALAMMQGGAVVLDVRESHELREGRIPGSLHIPMGELLARVHQIPRDRPVIVQCASGGRSAQVARFLAGRGHPQVHDLQGGLMGWRFQGLPVQA